MQDIKLLVFNKRKEGGKGSRNEGSLEAIKLASFYSEKILFIISSWRYAKTMECGQLRGGKVCCGTYLAIDEEFEQYLYSIYDMPREFATIFVGM